MADIRKMTTDLLIDHLTDFASTDEGNELRRRLGTMREYCESELEIWKYPYSGLDRMRKARDAYRTMEAERERP